MNRLMKALAIITSCGAFIMLLLGVLVTQTGSGQGCGGSWPFCHGQLLPDSMTLSSFYEYSHRIVSGTDGFLIVLLAAWSWLAYRKDFQVKLFSGMSVFFVVLQGVLGALTVVFEGTFAKDGLLSLHFGFSLISFASVILLTIRLFQMTNNKTQQQVTKKVTALTKSLQYTVWGLTAYTYLVVYTGAFVVHTNAITGCGKQFPTCGSTFFPNLSTTAGIQMLHRYAAGLLWFLTLWFMFVIIRNYRERQDLVKGSILAFALITLQAISGVTTIFTGGLLMAALTHTAIISIYFSVLCYLCVQVGWPWKKSESTSESEIEQLQLVANQRS